MKPKYEPTSRRPIATSFRRTARGAVAWCVRYDVHPDLVSYASVVMAALAAACFAGAGGHRWLLLFGPLFCYARLWCNMLDGMVALASGKASRHGEIINEVPDRVSDVIIFAGVAHSGLASLPLGYWCAIAALMTAYIGILGQAVGVQREFSGVMAKPWRMVVLHAGAWAMWFHLASSRETTGMTILDWALVVVLAGCTQTIVLRLARISRALRTSSPK